MNQKKLKSVWTIQRAAAEGVDAFALYDHTGYFIMSDQSRMKLADYAFDHGADEIKHDYDLLKYK